MSGFDSISATVAAAKDVPSLGQKAPKNFLIIAILSKFVLSSLFKDLETEFY